LASSARLFALNDCCVKKSEQTIANDPVRMKSRLLLSSQSRKGNRFASLRSDVVLFRVSLDASCFIVLISNDDEDDVFNGNEERVSILRAGEEEEE
jgi:hypothetical protein